MSEFDDYDPLFDGDDDFMPSFFRHGAMPSAVADTAELDDEDDVGVDARAYLLTGGRTGGGRGGVAIETIVILHDQADATWVHQREMRLILDVCDEPVAVAEVAAMVGLPLGVAQVLVGDLVADGLLIPSDRRVAMHDDIAFIERLIDRVSSL